MIFACLGLSATIHGEKAVELEELQNLSRAVWAHRIHFRPLCDKPGLSEEDIRRPAGGQSIMHTAPGAKEQIPPRGN